jgi:hypothetical protein
MSLSDLASLGSFVSGLAVLICVALFVLWKSAGSFSAPH